MAHHCHATNCSRDVPPSMFMCKAHWFSLPKAMQRKIWATYRRGQEDDKQPSRAYCLAAIEAVTFIAEKEGVTPNVRLYEAFMPDEEAQGAD